MMRPNEESTDLDYPDQECELCDESAILLPRNGNPKKAIPQSGCSELQT